MERLFGDVTAARARKVLKGEIPAGDSRLPPHQSGDASLRLLRRVGVVDPASLDDYRARDGYVALRRALDIGPAEVIREVTDAKLMGRGGAAFPTGRKWDAVALTTDREVDPNTDLGSG